MNADTVRRERGIFEAAREMSSAAREEYLERACGGDATLRQRIESLLQADDQAGSFLESPAFSSDPSLLTLLDPESLLGSVIGRYQLIEIIAQGGMGVVYKAQQESPSRTVALKVMRCSLEDHVAVERFRYEVECLGRLRHPGIAQIIEAGVHAETAGGPSLPYFAMEYVPDARTLSTYLRESELDRRAALEVMIAVCEAVHHGHLNGVVHCDLKPANILVDGAGQVRIIDFGIARTLDHERLDNTEAIGTTRAGTVQYMSPEQCTSGSEVDARSDVYSLGVVFYEALCDALPYEVREATISSAAAIIQNEQPRRPREVDGRFPVDLEAVLLKALAKAPAERFASASELAADLRRFLSHEPVTARPAIAAYQLRLLARRHRVGVAAILAMVLIVLTAVGVTGALMARLQAAREASAAQTHRAKSINEFVLDLVNSADPTRSNRAGLRVVDLLRDSYDDVEDKFGVEPLTAAGLHSLIGLVLEALQELDEAKTHLSRSVQLYETAGHGSSPEAMLSVSHIAAIDVTQGRFDEGLSRIDVAIEGFRRANDRRGMVVAMLDKAIMLYELGRTSDALGLLNQTESDVSTLPSDQLRFYWWNGKGLVQIDLGQTEAALDSFQQALKFAKLAQGEVGHNVAGCQQNIALIYRRLGRLAEALDMIRASQSTFRRLEGEESPFALLSGINEAELLLELGQLEESAAVAESTYAGVSARFGADAPYTLSALAGLAEVHMKQHRYTEAEREFEEVVSRRTEVLGEDHVKTLRSRIRLASVMGAQEKFEAQLDLLNPLLEHIERALDPYHVLALEAKLQRVVALADSGQLVIAIQEGEAYLSDWSGLTDAEAEYRFRLINVMEQLYDEARRPEDATRVRSMFEAHQAPKREN
ncbi:MAG: serine/threonine protein kinase [Phycisphaerales bacterium]|nr:serine/threonine protein kinase [Phycisphaerales bacterium]